MFPHTTKILIVDDMEATRLTEKKALQKLGFTHFFEAENGIKALKVLNQQAALRQPIELIICDWTMPDLNGLELIKKMKNNDKLKDIPMIMVSATSEPAKILEAIKTGVTDYILKPFDSEILERKLEIVWDKLNNSSDAD